MTKLCLGSGISYHAALRVITTKPEEWKCIDVCPHYQAQEHYDFSEGIREPDSSVDEIWMGDSFEHIFHHRAPRVLAECYRVMVPEGKILLSVPDMEICMRRFLESDGQDCKELIWGQQDQLTGRNSFPDSHYNGFTERSLGRALVEAGFHDAKRVDIHKNWFELAMVAYK